MTPKSGKVSSKKTLSKTFSKFPINLWLKSDIRSTCFQSSYFPICDSLFKMELVPISSWNITWWRGHGYTCTRYMTWLYFSIFKKTGISKNCAILHVDAIYLHLSWEDFPLIQIFICELAIVFVWCHTISLLRYYDEMIFIETVIQTSFRLRSVSAWIRKDILLKKVFVF